MRLNNLLYYFLLIYSIVVTLSLVITIKIGNDYVDKNKNIFEEYETVKADIQSYRNQLEEDYKLGSFIMMLMDEVKADLSPIKRQILAQTIVRVTNNIFEKQDHKYNFAVLLALESKFNNNAKSPVGAVGISQIMPKYAESFAKICGIDDYTPNDLLDAELNMTIGACQFNALMMNKTINGNVAAALVAYNAGINSVSFRDIVGLKNITASESASYVAKFTFLTSKVTEILNKNVAINDESNQEQNP
jgi:membrane-bound lytic murein transglycosylase MltF